MKETKPYWYHNTAYSMEQYFVSLDFPNLLTSERYLKSINIFESDKQNFLNLTCDMGDPCQGPRTR